MLRCDTIACPLQFSCRRSYVDSFAATITIVLASNIHVTQRITGMWPGWKPLFMCPSPELYNGSCRWCICNELVISMGLYRPLVSINRGGKDSGSAPAASQANRDWGRETQANIDLQHEKEQFQVSAVIEIPDSCLRCENRHG